MSLRASRHGAVITDPAGGHGDLERVVVEWRGRLREIAGFPA
jgi:hypothetical protein